VLGGGAQGAEGEQGQDRAFQRTPRSAESLGVDPFALTCNPAAYVPRPACEAALAALARALEQGRLAALTGPPGMGKTLLLRVLASRLAGRMRCLYVPYGALDAKGLCQLALGLLERTVDPTRDAEQQLLEAIEEESASGRPLLLLLDDANAVPLPTLRWLSALVGRLGGALRLLAVPVDDALAARALAALGPGVAHVRFTQPMDVDETARYVAGRLERAGADAKTLARLTPDVVRWLHRESAGVPRRLQQLATWILRHEGPAPDSVARIADEGPWLELDEGEERDLG
jgi:type II secretory pathway predicted ATPase ExeA